MFVGGSSRIPDDCQWQFLMQSKRRPRRSSKREEEERGGETTKRVEMLIAIANTAVKSRKEASVSPTHNIVTEEKATRWGAEKTRHNVESG